MKNLSKLIKEYTTEKHEAHFNKSLGELDDWELTRIYSNSWDADSDKMPYELITHLLDSYYLLPQRPDLAFTMCWQAINNSYNEMILSDSNCGVLQDTLGIQKLVDTISDKFDTKYREILDPYIKNIPVKLFNYVSNYLLKGYVVESHRINPKYNNSAYRTFCKKANQDLVQAFKNTYGESYNKICSPVVVSNRVDFGIEESNSKKSHQIVRSLSQSLKLLLENKQKTFFNSDQSKNYVCNFSEKDQVHFLIFLILYASRCNNSHGNVAARLNSIYSTADTYEAYKYIYLLSHAVLAISLNINGHITDDELKLTIRNHELLNIA